jgi:hypothetical protein
MKIKTKKFEENAVQMKTEFACGNIVEKTSVRE